MTRFRLWSGQGGTQMPTFGPAKGRISVQIKISTRHGHLSDATREKIQAKVEKMGRLFERLTSIEVTVDLEREQSPAVDVQVSAEHKHDFVAAEESTSLMAALD